MTATAAVAGRAARDFVSTWCGWVLVGACALLPLLGWLSPQGFAPLMALVGLLCLPATRLTDEDRPLLVVLLAALVWAAVTTTWSPYQPTSLGGSNVLKLALQLPLYWAAVCGARRADPRLTGLALRLLAWGLALFGAVLLVEGFTGAGVYSRIYQAVYHQPVRPDLARTAMAHTTFGLAVLWPVVLVGGMRRQWELLLLIVAITGMVFVAHLFGADAPILAFCASSLAIAAVWLLPRLAPWLMAAKVAALFLFMPLIIWAVRAFGDYRTMEADVQLSWSARMSYWSHTVDWIRMQPWRGWGLDASRAMGPGIQLHPHNGELQIWLELGLAGAVAAAAFWGLSLMRLARREPSLPVASVAGSLAAYLLFATLNFGVWQEWWMALGAMIPVLAVMVVRQPPLPAST